MQFFAELWNGFKKAPVPAKGGVIIVVLYVFGSLFAPALAPYEES